MNKNSTLSIVTKVIFLAVVNLLFFIIAPIEKNNSVWLTYAFLNVACLLFIFTPLIATKGNKYALHLNVVNVISLVFVVLEVILAGYVVIKNSPSIRFSLGSQSVLLAAYLIIMIKTINSNDETEAKELIKTDQQLYIKDNSAKLSKIKNTVVQEDIKIKVSKLYDLLSSSPSKSNILVADLENRISGRVNELEMIAKDNNGTQITIAIDEISELIEKRNANLKTFQ